MTKLPDNENKDLIDLVREGKKIEIYESVPLLKEGDLIKDWEDSGLADRQERHLVGRPIKKFFGLFVDELCGWCDTPIHWVVEETKIAFVGRNGKTYFKYWLENERGRICPLCGDKYLYYKGYF